MSAAGSLERIPSRTPYDFNEKPAAQPSRSTLFIKLELALSLGNSASELFLLLIDSRCYFNCSIEKLSSEIVPKIGHGDVVQVSRCRLNRTAVVVGAVVNSKLKSCQLLLPLGRGGDCPR